MYEKVCMTEVSVLSFGYYIQAGTKAFQLLVFDELQNALQNYSLLILIMTIEARESIRLLFETATENEKGQTQI